MENTESIRLFYKDIIEVDAPWEITSVNKDELSRKATIVIKHDQEKTLACPIYAQSTKLYDH